MIGYAGWAQPAARPAARPAAAPSWNEAARVHAIRQALLAAGVPTMGGTHYQGPQAAVYHLAPAPADMGRALRQREAVEAAIDTPGVRLAQDGRWLAVEVPRRSREAVRFSVARPALGLSLRGQPITPRLDQAAPHGLVVAATGGGKTVALRTLAVLESLQAGTRLVLIDLEVESWQGFGEAGHLVASDEASVAAALAWCRGRLEGARDGERVVLMIDEAQMMPPASMAIVREIAERGRKHGVHLVLATQHPRYDVLDRRATANLGLRIVGRVQDAKAAALVGMPGAELLMGAGDVLVGIPGRDPIRIQVAMADSPGALAGRVDPLILGDLAEEPRPERQAPASDDAAMVAWAQAEGASARAIRLQFGIGQDRARRIRDAVGVTDRSDRAILRPNFRRGALAAVGQS